MLVDLQNFANNAKTPITAKILQSWIVVHDKMDLCCNFQKNLFTDVWVLGPEMDLFSEFIFPTLKVFFSETTGWIASKLGLNVPYDVLDNFCVFIFDLLKKMAAVTKNKK